MFLVPCPTDVVQAGIFKLKNPLKSRTHLKPFSLFDKKLQKSEIDVPCSIFKLKSQSRCKMSKKKEDPSSESSFSRKFVILILFAL